jgi:nucleoside-diphosphate-sugar epimerase
MKVLVAGATGALGTPTVKELVRRGHEVYGLTRDRGKFGRITALGARPVTGDVLDEASIEAAVSETRPEAVIQLLNAIPKRGAFRPGDLDATNVLRTEGTRNLLGAATRHGVKRYLVESMIFGYGYGDRGQQPLEEDAPFGSHVDNTKMNQALDALQIMERMVLDTSDHPQIQGIVLRLGLFYGPNVGSTEFMISMLRRHMMFLPGGGKGQLSWIHVEDGATAVAEALEKAPAGAVFNVVDDEPASLAATTAEMARVLDLPGPKSIPVGLAKIATSYAAQMAQTNLRASNRRIKEELGWEPAYPTYREGTRTLVQTSRSGSTGSRSEALT